MGFLERHEERENKKKGTVISRKGVVKLLATAMKKKHNLPERLHTLRHVITIQYSCSFRKRTDA